MRKTAPAAIALLLAACGSTTPTGGLGDTGPGGGGRDASGSTDGPQGPRPDGSAPGQDAAGSDSGVADSGVGFADATPSADAMGLDATGHADAHSGDGPIGGDGSALDGGGNSDAAPPDGTGLDATGADATGLDATSTDVDGGPPVTCPNPLPGSLVISGTEVTTFVTDNGDQNQPVNVSTATVSVVMKDPARGCWMTYRGSGTTNGTFSVSGVPDGTRYVRVGNFYLDTASTTLDFGFAQLGRPDAVPATQATTQLNLTITNANPWQASDDAELFSSNAGVWAGSLPFLAVPPPQVGSSSLSMTLPWIGNVFPPNLIDGNAGDAVIITQMVTHPAPNNDTYEAVDRSFQPAAFTMIDAQTTTISGAYQPVLPSETTSISIAWSRSQFEGLRASVSPAAMAGSHTQFISALPEVDRGFYANALDLVEYFPAAAIDTTTSLVYGNPLPAQFGTFLQTSDNFIAQIPVPGAMTAANLFASIADYRLAPTPGATTTIIPTLGPVQQPMMNGRSLFTDLTAVGTTPTIAWAAPAIGTPTIYLVRIEVLEVGPNGRGRARAVAFIQTARTTIDVPPGILIQGSRYAAVITARTQAGIDGTTTPNRAGFPESDADLITNAFAP